MSDMDTDGKHNDDEETETEREGDHDCHNHSESNWLSQSLGTCDLEGQMVTSCELDLFLKRFP